MVADTGEFSRDKAFLFRVYTPKGHVQLLGKATPYFIGPAFDEDFTAAPASLSEAQLRFHSKNSSYEDAVRHLDWTTRPSSPFVSTSSSFVWSIWEALRRYRIDIKHDIHIAVIDSTAISERCVAAIKLLERGKETRYHREHGKWVKFAQESQSVLVYGSIPASAVYSSIPLLPLLDKLPSYLLHSDSSPVERQLGPIGMVAWDSSHRRTSYKRFCRDMYDRFSNLPLEARLRDTTAGSVRLAIAFMKPWFHIEVIRDFGNAVEVLSRLSACISDWPGRWWPQEHQAEIFTAIHAMVMVVAEEIRDSEQERNIIERTTMKSNVVRSPRAARAQRRSLTPRRRVLSPAPHPWAVFVPDQAPSVVPQESMGHEEEEAEPLVNPIEIHPSPTAPRSSSGGQIEPDGAGRGYAPSPEVLRIQVDAASDLISTEVYRALTISVADVVMPVQESLAAARNSAVALLGSDDFPVPISAVITTLEARSAHDGTLDESDMSDSASEPSSPMLPHRHVQEYTDTEATDTDCGEMEWDIIPSQNCTTGDQAAAEDSPLLEVAMEPALDAEETPDRKTDDTPQIDDNTSTDDSTPTAENDLGLTCDTIASTASSKPKPIPESPIQHHPGQTSSALETASYMLTCFLVGSLIALCVLSPHRRSLANHFT